MILGWATSLHRDASAKPELRIAMQAMLQTLPEALIKPGAVISAELARTQILSVSLVCDTDRPPEVA